MNRLTRVALAASFIALIGLVACGGGGDDALEEAAIDDTSAQALGVAAAQAAQQAITNSTTSIPGAPFQPGIGGSVASAQGIPNPCDTGSISFSGENPITINYNSCGILGVLLNGIVTFAFSGDFDSITVQYNNFTSVFDGMTISFAGYGYTCTGLNSVPVCTFQFGDFTSTLTGVAYDIDDIDVDGDEMSGFTVNGSVGDPAFGQIDFTTEQNIFFDDCDFGVPNDGLITFQGGNGSSGSIEFQGCESFLVCYMLDEESDEVCLDPFDWSIFD